MRDEWYFARRGPDGNTRHGPVPLQELRDMVDSGRVRGDDLVWRQGMADWQRADQCDALVPLAPARPGPRGYPRDDRLEARPYVRRRSSGTMVALIVGGVVLAVGLLACGGGFLYWTLNRGSVIKSAGASPYAPPDWKDSSMQFGLGELEYTSNVSQADAQTVVAYLYKTGYFSSDHAALVQLDREEDGTIVLRCCVKSSMIWDANAAKGFQDLRAYIADHLLYGPTEIELCDEEMQTQRTFTASDSFGGGAGSERK